MKIVWDKVTRFSQIIAVILFVATFCLAFQFGRNYESTFILGAPVMSVKYACAEGKFIHADFYKHIAHLEIGLQTVLYLPQTTAEAGFRYATDDETVIFWDRGKTATLTETAPNNVVYKNCVKTSQ